MTQITCNMTDFGRLQQIFIDFGIPHEVIRHPDESFEVLVKENPNDSEALDAYNGFYTQFMFADDGKFTQMGIYE